MIREIAKPIAEIVSQEEADVTAQDLIHALEEAAEAEEQLAQDLRQHGSRGEFAAQASLGNATYAREQAQRLRCSGV